MAIEPPNGVRAKRKHWREVETIAARGRGGVPRF